MKANRHDYDTIFSVCVLYAAHGIFITIKYVYDYKLCGVIKHTKAVSQFVGYFLRSAYLKADCVTAMR